MIKTILSTAVVAMAFSGCVGTANKVANDTAEVTSSAAQSAKSVQETVTGATNTVNSATTVVEGAEATATPTGSLTDMAVDKAVEVADEHTDGKASIVKELIVD